MFTGFPQPDFKHNQVSRQGIFNRSKLLQHLGEKAKVLTNVDVLFDFVNVNRIVARANQSSAPKQLTFAAALFFKKYKYVVLF